MQHKITIEMIETKDFSIEREGYNPKEVDSFLDDIIDEMDLREKETRELRQQLSDAMAQVAASADARQAVKEPAPAKADGTPDGAFREILEMAQKVKNDTINEAQKKADDIIADAEAQARSRLGNLMEEKESLTRQVEALKKTVTEYRSRFAEVLKAQQEALDKVAEL